MKRSRGTALLVVSLLAFAGILPAAPAAAEDLWFEDFEQAGAPGSAPSGWEAIVDMDATVKLVDVSALNPPSGRLAAALEDESYSISSQMRRKFGAALPQGAIEYLVWVSPAKPAEAYVEIRADRAGKVFDCHLSGGGNLKCRSKGSLLTLVEGLDVGVWQRVRLEWDTSTWTYRAYLNGEDVTPPEGLSFDVQGVPSEVNFKVGSNPKTEQLAYFDDVRVTR